MTHKSVLKSLSAVLVAAAAVSGASGDANACGGFFCSQTQPVNQAAEQIIFADNGDGTVTAVIQIMYEGPAENFSWLLPISSVPEGDQIALSSDLAFQRLQAATNPQYNLTTRIEGTCRRSNDSVLAAGGDSDAAEEGSGGEGGGGPGDDGVSVLASGSVGAFEWTVIALDESLEDPAEAAVTWLEGNGYDVSPGSPDLIRPYLEDGLYLLALRLTKGADSGSIRPILLTYEADQPMIPIRLTAVAANDDMGVMTFLLSEARAVPQNYMALELNEARINWFNAAQNYNDVVIAAADDAGGQGFVTEYAGSTEIAQNVIWTDFDEEAWQDFIGSVSSNFDALFEEAYFQWGDWDGFWDAVRVSVMIPEDIPLADFQMCPQCYPDRIEFSPSDFVAALEENVIDPVRETQALVNEFPYMTRLYSTLSAAEMTADPLFTFNSDLEELSNIHSAEQVIECNPDVFQSQAPWRIELPQGGVIRGHGRSRVWPGEVDDQPANIRILRQSNSGQGNVVEDNAESITQALGDYNESLGLPRGEGSTARDDDGGCSVSNAGSNKTNSWALAVLLVFSALLSGRRGSRGSFRRHVLFPCTDSARPRGGSRPLRGQGELLRKVVSWMYRHLGLISAGSP